MTKPAFFEQKYDTSTKSHGARVGNGPHLQTELTPSHLE